VALGEDEDIVVVVEKKSKGSRQNGEFWRLRGYYLVTKMYLLLDARDDVL